MQLEEVKANSVTTASDFCQYAKEGSDLMKSNNFCYALNGYCDEVLGLFYQLQNDRNEPRCNYMECGHCEIYSIWS